MVGLLIRNRRRKKLFFAPPKSVVNKIFLIFILLFRVEQGVCQLTQISTNSNATLRDVSVIKKNILIGGYFGFLGTCNNECNTLTNLTIPGPVGNATRIQRIDTNTIFLISYTTSQAFIYKSLDAGNNWVQKLSTTGDFNFEIAFFDSLEGMYSKPNGYSRTTDGGTSWTSGTIPINFPDGVNSFKIYGDSMICAGSSTGNFYLSKDRGHTWPLVYAYGFAGYQAVTNFFFLNKDTIFAISYGGGFAKTLNGGLNWDNSAEPPIAQSHHITGLQTTNEIYVVGANSQNKGIVIKTTDFGQTWQTFNTGFNTTLLNITLLNDSIALLSGTNGVLLKWNYKNALFTGLNDNYLDNLGLQIYPTPVKDKLHLEYDQSDLKLEITNSLGQTIYSPSEPLTEKEIDLSFLNNGVYFVKIQNSESQKIVKLIKD